MLLKLQDSASKENDKDDIVRTKRLPCDCHSLKLCEWRVMEYELSDEREDGQDRTEGCGLPSRELAAMIPCGLQANTMFVVALTILVTLSGMLYLCVNIISASPNT